MREVFGHLPLLVVQLTLDGMVLSVNEQTSRVTGYAIAELVGKNWWGTMFPGKLFKQVPKFISVVDPGGVLRDVPMVIATKDGQQRTIAWTRFTRELPTGGRETVLIGMDLTDRLSAADREAALGADAKAEVRAEEVDGSFVKPIAASPPKLAADHGHQAIQEVHEFLTQVDQRIDALEAALSQGELDEVASLANRLMDGAHACGLLNVSTIAARLYHAAAQGSTVVVTREINDLVALCRQPAARS